MKNLQELTQELTKAGLKFEIEFPQSFARYSFEKVIDEYSAKTDYETAIGIEIKSSVWAWFKAYSFEDVVSENFEFSFKQRYNANTGTVLKSIGTQVKVVDFLKSKGVNIN